MSAPLILGEGEDPTPDVIRIRPPFALSMIGVLVRRAFGLAHFTNADPDALRPESFARALEGAVHRVDRYCMALDLDPASLKPGLIGVQPREDGMVFTLQIYR